MLNRIQCAIYILLCPFLVSSLDGCVPSKHAAEAFGGSASALDDNSLQLLQRSASMQTVQVSPLQADYSLPSNYTDAILFLELGTEVHELSFERAYQQIGVRSACTVSALVSFVVVIVYWPQGPLVIVRILVYIFALASMKLTVKFVFKHFAFNYPKFLTAGHLLLSGAVGFILVTVRQRINRAAIPVPTWDEFSRRIGPIAAAFAFSLAMNNSALVFCSAAYAEIVGATTPIVTVFITVLMGLEFNPWLLLPTLMVMIGCTLSVSGEVNISIVGTALCFLANLGRAVKAAFQQEVLTCDTRAKFDPSALLAWTCTTSCAIMLVWSLLSEGFAPFRDLHARLAADSLWPMLGAILASCVNACLLNLIVLYVTKDLGAVGQLIAGQVASVLTVGGGVLLFDDHLSTMQVCGFITVLSGAFAYSRISKAGHGYGSIHKLQPPLRAESDEATARGK